MLAVLLLWGSLLLSGSAGLPASTPPATTTSLEWTVSTQQPRQVVLRSRPRHVEIKVSNTGPGKVTAIVRYSENGSERTAEQEIGAGQSTVFSYNEVVNVAVTLTSGGSASGSVTGL